MSLAGIDVFVSVGTDIHEFPRLIDWVDAWLTDHPDDADRWLVQHGYTRPSSKARNARFLGPDEMAAVMTSARTIIGHGGPATLFEARANGVKPICVPRDPQLGEHIDDHQQRFVRHVHDMGLVTLCEDRDSFTAALARHRADPDVAVVPVGGDEAQQAIDNLEHIVTDLAEHPSRRARLLSRLIRRPQED